MNVGRSVKLADVTDGGIVPDPFSAVPTDVSFYHSFRAQAGATSFNLAPVTGLPVLQSMDPRAQIDVGRDLYVAGYTNVLPVGDVSAQLGMESNRINSNAYGGNS